MRFWLDRAKEARWASSSISFQGSALERAALEALPHVFVTQEAGASDALRPQAEPGIEFKQSRTRQVRPLFTAPLWNSERLFVVDRFRKRFGWLWLLP